MQIYFHSPPLLIFTKGANISGGHCICWQTGDPLPIFAPKGLDLSWMLLLYQIIITITC